MTNRAGGINSSIDAEYEYKRWLDGQALRIEDCVLRSILSALRHVGEDSQLKIVAAIREAMLASWEAGWDAATGEDNG